jgi:hypothetical protein
MTRIQVRARTYRRVLDPDLSPNLDPRDPDILRAKVIARSVPHKQKFRQHSIELVGADMAAIGKEVK